MQIDWLSIVMPTIEAINFAIFFIIRWFIIILVAFGIGFFVSCKAAPWNLTADKLRGVVLRSKIYDFVRWFTIDVMECKERAGFFNEYGFTFFVGRQGAGKTISMVEYLERMKEKYPECQIVTNFSYAKADFRMEHWRDLTEIRNGTKGVIFAIDEIQNEYSAASWKDFPETLLSEISQQRKQRIKIVATSQVFSRVAKPLREQAFTVVVCNTFLRRWTFCKEYDAAEYCASIDGAANISTKLKTLRKWSFVQSDLLRQLYDTYEKIERMQKLEFIPRHQRVE